MNSTQGWESGVPSPTQSSQPSCWMTNVETFFIICRFNTGALLDDNRAKAKAGSGKSHSANPSWARKWLNLPSMAPRNLWTSRRKAEVWPRTDDGWGIKKLSRTRYGRESQQEFWLYNSESESLHGRPFQVSRGMRSKVDTEYICICVGDGVLPTVFSPPECFLCELVMSHFHC